MYGASHTLKKELFTDRNIESFEDYKSLSNGYNGEYVLDDFEVNFGIVSGNFSNSFADWRGEDEVLLWVMFGYHDLSTGEIVPQLEDKFALQINAETTEEVFGDLTPTPDMRTPTPTPFTTQDVLSWLSFDSAKINIVNDEFKNVILENVNVNNANKPEELNKTQDYELVVWSIVKRSFDHDLREAYICDHSEECGGIDAPDAYGYNDAINNIINGKEDTLSSGYADISQFADSTLDGNIGDIGFTSVTKQSFMNFDQWRNEEELDLIVVFLTGKNGDDHIRVVAEDRIQLTSVSTFATPTPPEFIEEDPTPTPTPFTIHDLSSWMVFDPVKLIIHDDKIEKLSLKNVTIDNLNMPEFLGRESMFEVISFAIVKKDYDGSHASAYDASSDMVYGNSSNFIREESNELIGTSEQFYQLESVTSVT